MPEPKPKPKPKPKRAPMPKLADVAHALSEAHGVCTAAARSLGVTPASLRRRIRRSVTLQRLLAEIAVDNLDLAEAALLAAVREGKLSAITYYLRTRAPGVAGTAHNEEASTMSSRSATADGETTGASAAQDAAAVDLTRLSDDDLRLLDEILAKALPESHETLSADRRACAPKRGRKRPSA